MFKEYLNDVRLFLSLLASILENVLNKLKGCVFLSFVIYSASKEDAKSDPRVFKMTNNWNR